MANTQETLGGLIQLLKEETTPRCCCPHPAVKRNAIRGDDDLQRKILTELVKVLRLDINCKDKDLESFSNRLGLYLREVNENPESLLCKVLEAQVPRITHYTNAERNILGKHRLEIHLDQVRWGEFKAVVEIDASSGKTRICPLVEAKMEVGTAICPFWDAPSKELYIVLIKHYMPTCDQWVIDLPGGVVDRDEKTSKAILREVKEETCIQVRKPSSTDADAKATDEALNAAWASISAAWGVQNGGNNDAADKTEPVALPKSSTSKGLLNETMQPWLLPLVELKPGAKVCREKPLEGIDGAYLIEGEVHLDEADEKPNQMKAFIAPWNKLGAVLDELSTKTNEHGDSLYRPMITVSTLAYRERLQNGMTKIGKCLEKQ